MVRLYMVALLFTVSSVILAQSPNSLRVSKFNLKDGHIALHGYDPVSYFGSGGPQKGNSQISTTYEGVLYYFSSNANKNSFDKNPAQYEPQFGGWCAYAMGKDGSEVDVDPATYKIIDNKLYLFYHTFFNNTLNTWNEDQVHLLPNANKNWVNYFR